MQTLQINSIDYVLTADGRLQHPEDWNEEVARALAEVDGLELTSERWNVIHIMRAYYQEYNISPTRKLLKKSLITRHSPEVAEDEYLSELFPNDVLIQGTRIAGLPISLLDVELDRTLYSTIKKEHHTASKTSFNQEVEFGEKLIKVSSNGNLVNLDDWSEPLAEFMAEKEGITLKGEYLSAEHWEVIRFLRKFYFEYGISPMVKLLMKHMRDQLGGQKGSRSYLYGLFPGGPSRQGSRIAGLPEPQGCIDP